MPLDESSRLRMLTGAIPATAYLLQLSAFALVERLERQSLLGSRQPFHGFFGEVTDDHIGTGALDADQALKSNPLQIQPATLRRGMNHGILATDLVGRKRNMHCLS